MEKLKPHTLLEGMLNGTVALENNLRVSKNVKHILTI